MATSTCARHHTHSFGIQRMEGIYVNVSSYVDVGHSLCEKLINDA